MKKITLLLLLLSSTFSIAQEQYKYMIIPSKFSFFKEENKYNLNSVSKYFFEKEGFQVYFDTETLPEELAKNRCLAVYANAIENNTLFLTKITFEIKDCHNTLIFTSNQGTSREKDLKTANTLAFREALSSMSTKLKLKTAPQKTIYHTTVEPITTIESNTKENDVASKTTETTNPLFAIPTSNGYKLVDANPSTIMVLYNTSNSSIFIAKKDTIQGVLIKNNGNWIFEYYINEKLVSEKVAVKF